MERQRVVGPASYSNLFADGRWLVRLREKPWQPTLFERIGFVARMDVSHIHA